MKININGKEFEVSDEDLTTAIEAKEGVAIESDVVMRTQEEETTFVKNTQKDGFKTGSEIGRKEVLKGFGLEGEGHHKSDESAIEAINSFVDSKVSTALTDAKIEPDKKVAEAIADKDKVLSNFNNLQTEFDTFKSETKIAAQNQKRISTLSSLIPSNVIDGNIALDVMSVRLKTGFDENGNLYGVGQDGLPMKNPTTMEVLPMKDVVSSFFDNNKTLLKAASGGAGGGDSGGGSGGKQSQADFQKEMKESKIGLNSPEMIKVMNERLKAGTLSTE